VVAVPAPDRQSGRRICAGTDGTLPSEVVQAKASLWAAQGLANQEIARRREVDSDAVRRWRARFAQKCRRCDPLPQGSHH
jgi:hypothetical protein